MREEVFANGRDGHADCVAGEKGEVDLSGFDEFWLCAAAGWINNDTVIVMRWLTCQIPRIKRGANNVCQCSNFSISTLIIGNSRCGSFSTLQSIYAKQVSVSPRGMTAGTHIELDVDVGGFHQEF